MKNRVRFWTVLRPLSALLLLVAASALWFGCNGNPDTGGQQGSACSTNDDCVSELECRAKKCRTKIPNTKPIAVLSVDPNKGAKVGDKILLIGEKSRDDEGDSLTFKWTLDGPKDSKAKVTDPKAARTFFNPDKAGEYTVGLIVNDGKEDSDLISLKVVVEDVQNTDPIANAGPDQEVLPGSKATLDGTNSTDPDGDKLTYLWTLKTKPDGSNASLDKPEFEKPSFTPDLPGDYIVSLVVTDARAAKSQEDTVTIRAVKDLNKIPAITSVTPDTATAESVVDVVVKGKDFADGAKLLIGPKAVATNFVSDTELKVKLNLGGLTPGDNEIKIENPNGKSSNGVKFVVKPIPVPELTKLDPALAPSGARLTVKVIGKNFVQNSVVQFETTPLKTTFKSETEISATLDLRGTSEGEYKITVKNPGGVSAKTNLTFKVIRPGPPPVLKVLNPPQGTTGKKLPFSVHGTGFEIGATIVFDGKDIKTKRIRRDELQADPDLDLTKIPTGKYQVWVRNVDGQISGKEEFIVDGIDPTPKLDRVLPFLIYIGEKAKLSVFGNSFSPKAKFYINQVEIPINPARSSTTFIEALFDGTNGKWKPGNYKAYVENPKGKKSNEFNVTVTHPTPTIDAVTPGGWNVGCDVDVTITGRNFVATSEVNFGSNKFKQGLTNKFKLTRVGSTELKFSIAKADLNLTTYNLNVVNGPSAKSTDYRFPVLNTSNVPGIRSMRPGAGAADSIVSVNLSYDFSIGRFLPGAYVEVNGKRMPTSCNLSSTNQYCFDLTAKIDLAGVKPGNLDIYVVNPCGKKSTPTTFVVTEAPTPYLTEVKPAYATVGQKTVISLTGRDFAKNHSLYINNKKVDSTWKSDTEIITNAAFDFTGIAAGSHIDIYVAHANGKKTPVVKYTVLAAQPPLTITDLSADKFDIGKAHKNVEVSGTGFTTNTKLYMDGKLLTTTFGGPVKLTIGSLDLTNVTGGVKLLQAKETGKDSNYYPLFAAPPPSPVVDYLSPSSRTQSSSTSTYLYIYGSRFCPGVSGRCPTNPKAQAIGPDKKDYSSNYVISRSYDRYVYGNFSLSGIPTGDYIFTVIMPGGVKSNPGVFKYNPPPPPKLTSVSSPFRGGSTRNITLSGSNFAPGDLVVFSFDKLNRFPVSGSSSSSISVSVDLTKIKFESEHDVHILRCHDKNCTKSTKSNSLKVRVLEIPSCTILANGCGPDIEPKNSEVCGTKQDGSPTCRPKCTTDAQCKAMLGATSTTKCHPTKKYCQY